MLLSDPYALVLRSLHNPAVKPNTQEMIFCTTLLHDTQSRSNQKGATHVRLSNGTMQWATLKNKTKHKKIQMSHRNKCQRPQFMSWHNEEIPSFNSDWYKERNWKKTMLFNSILLCSFLFIKLFFSAQLSEFSFCEVLPDPRKTNKSLLRSFEERVWCFYYFFFVRENLFTMACALSNILTIPLKL